MNTSAQIRTRAIAVLASLLVFFLCGGQSAMAGWPLPAWGEGIAFGQSYASGGGNALTHSGLDISAPAGSQIFAPLSGSVSFVGRVPAGEGATQLAVSVVLDSGETLSLMPFDHVSAERGARVSEGGVLGSLAVQGDRSSTEPHLHVGLRRASLYLDPLTLLCPPAVAEGRSTEPVKEMLVQPAIPGPISATEPAVESPVAVSSSVAGMVVPEAAPIASALPAAAPSPVSAPASTFTPAPATAPGASVSRIPEITPSTRVRGTDSLSVTTYGGDARLLEGLMQVLGTRSSARTILLTMFCALTGILTCFGAVRAMSRRTTSDEAPNDTPVRKVAAAAGRW